MTMTRRRRRRDAGTGHRLARTEAGAAPRLESAGCAGRPSCLRPVPAGHRLDADRGQRATGAVADCPSAERRRVTQTWWLSFCDPNRPTGTQFLGAPIVDVTEAQAVAASQQVAARRTHVMRDGEPISAAACWATDPAACWISGAIGVAHATGCNPGGEVGAMRMDHLPGWAERSARYPRGVLL